MTPEQEKRERDLFEAWWGPGDAPFKLAKIAAHCAWLACVAARAERERALVEALKQAWCQGCSRRWDHCTCVGEDESIGCDYCRRVRAALDKAKGGDAADVSKPVPESHIVPRQLVVPVTPPPAAEVARPGACDPGAEETERALSAEIARQHAARTSRPLPADLRALAQEANDALGALIYCDEKAMVPGGYQKLREAALDPHRRLFDALRAEPPVPPPLTEAHASCHDVECNGDRSRPRAATGSSCSCAGRDSRSPIEELERYIGKSEDWRVRVSEMADHWKDCTEAHPKRIAVEEAVRIVRETPLDPTNYGTREAIARRLREGR